MDAVFQFPERIARATSNAAVCAELLSVTEPLGYSIYAIGGLPHPDTPYPTDFMVANWPAVWHATYYEKQFGDRDPTLRAFHAYGRPFSVKDLLDGKLGFLPTDEEREVLDFAATLGATNGFLVPVYRAHGYLGLACVAGSGPDPAPEVRALLQFVLEHAHDRLRALTSAHAVAANAHGPAVQLSPREIAILSLARNGLSDAAIAKAAEISVRTVRFHFENARRKLAARSRAEAIAIAVGRHMLPG